MLVWNRILGACQSAGRSQWVSGAIVVGLVWDARRPNNLHTKLQQMYRPAWLIRAE